MADQKRWFKVWTSILDHPRFQEMSLEDIGRWVLLGASTALNGEAGKLPVVGQAKHLCQLLRVPTLRKAKEVMKRLGSVQFEEGKNRYGEHSVTWNKWKKYQEDSTAAERMKTLRSKKRREESISSLPSPLGSGAVVEKQDRNPEREKLEALWNPPYGFDPDGNPNPPGKPLEAKTHGRDCKCKPCLLRYPGPRSYEDLS